MLCTTRYLRNFMILLTNLHRLATLFLIILQRHPTAIRIANFSILVVHELSDPQKLRDLLLHLLLTLCWLLKLLVQLAHSLKVAIA